MGKQLPPGASGRAGRREPRLGSQEKKKINSKPIHLDEQEIPYRLQELMKSREEMKNPKSRKRRKAASKRKPAVPGDIPVPKFKRQKRESEQAYIQRMEQETQHVLFLTKNQPQHQPEKEEPAPEKSQKKKEFQKKRLEHVRRKKEEKRAAMLEKALFQDPVHFGEVALQPPVLSVKPRKGVAKEKAGPRQLLLTSLLAPSHSAPARKVPPPSLARQRIVEEERERVIQAYRDWKSCSQQRASESRPVGKKRRKPC